MAGFRQTGGFGRAACMTALLFAAEGTGTATAGPAHPVILTCTSTVPVATGVTGTLCAALSDALQDLPALGGRPVLVPAADGAQPESGPDSPPDSPPHSLSLVLTVTRADSRALVAHLSWHSGASAPVRGPDVTLGMQDRDLTPDRYPRIIGSLLQVSDIPF